MLSHTAIDLSLHCNATAASYDADRTCGNFNAWGNTFPAEEIPFGSTLMVGGIPFDLRPKDPDRETKEEVYDHVETLGQTINLPQLRATSGIALLCCGEMGDQELNLRLYAGETLECDLSMLGRAWLVENDAPADEGRHLCSHLHYVGGYELSLLRPALWCSRIDWQPSIPITKAILGRNPLFHLFAMTFLHESQHD